MDRLLRLVTETKTLAGLSNKFIDLMDNKMRKKEEKEAKALVEGRDLEAERRLQAERQKSGEGTKKRDKRWNTRMETADTTFKVCVDCGFEDLMTSKEINIF